MKLRRIKLSFALCYLFFLLNSCGEQGKPKNAFLVRTNHVQFDEFRRELLLQTNTDLVYIKIFDVVFNEWQQRPLPLAQVEFDTASLKWLKSSGIEIVPVLYINNDLLEKVNPDRINALADRIMMLLKTRLDQFDIINEKIIHIDCDWSVASKEKYFDLLQYMEILPFFTNKQITVAVRPRQVENSVQYGIPPVKRAVYTLDVQNEEFKPDLIKDYPIELDLLLPLFNDPVVFRNGAVIGAISGLPDSVWMNDKVCRIAGEHPEATKTTNHFEVINDTVVRLNYLKTGDQIKYPGWDTAMVSRLAGFIQSNLKSLEPTIILNQLDSVKIRQYNPSQLKAAFNSFNKD